MEHFLLEVVCVLVWGDFYRQLPPQLLLCSISKIYKITIELIPYLVYSFLPFMAYGSRTSGPLHNNKIFIGISFVVATSFHWP